LETPQVLESEGFFFVQLWLGIDDKFAGTASLISINFAVEDDLFAKAGMLNGGLYIIWLEKKF
jgi:hypothetical protein